MDKNEIRRGWPVLLGVTIAMIAGVGTLPYYTAGMFVTSLQQTFGWSRSAISLGPSIFILGLVLTTPLIGSMTDRLDPRKLVVVGVVVVALSFGGLSVMSGGIFEYYGALALMSVLGNLSGACAVTPILVGSFARSRGAALGIAMAGIGLGSAVGGPLVAQAIATHGWRGGYRAMSAFCFAMAPLIWGLLRCGNWRATVPPTKVHPGLSVREALASSTYWYLSTAFFLIALGSTGLIVHFVPLLTDRGMDARAAASVSSTIGLCVIASRLFSGFLVDRLFAPRVAMTIMLTGAAGYVAFVLGGTRFAYVGALAVGISFGAETDLVGFLVARYFGLRNYGRLFGVMYGLCLSGTAVSPALYGWVADRMGTYVPMILAAVGLLTAAAWIFAMLPPYPRWQNVAFADASLPGGEPVAP